MTYVFAAVLIVAYIAALGFCFWTVTDFDASRSKRVAATVLGTALVIGGLTALFAASDDDRPCVREVTEMRYDPATKIVRPMTYCVERGEWAE